MVNEKQLKEIIEGILPDESLFIVDLKISLSKVPGKLFVTLDGDNGIGIDQCAEVSRKLGNLIEEEALIEDPYNLEVSSPGLDQPFKLLRQYHKNIGKTVTVKLKDGSEVSGLLESVTEEGFEVREEKITKNKSKKSYQAEPKRLVFDEVSKTNILIQF